MKINQLSIFLENKSGRLAEVTRILGNAHINIRALSIADSSDFGILRIIVDKVEDAISILKENHFTVSKTEVVAIEIKDEPGALANVLDILHKEAINVEYMYAFVDRSHENAIDVLKFDNIDRAISVLTKNSVALIEAKTLYNL